MPQPSPHRDANRHHRVTYPQARATLSAMRKFIEGVAFLLLGAALVLGGYQVLLALVRLAAGLRAW